jgi:hypothetical protein
MRPLHQFVQPARAIEQRILGVQMKMDKISVRHQIILPFRANPKQAADVHNAGKIFCGLAEHVPTCLSKVMPLAGAGRLVSVTVAFPASERLIFFRSTLNVPVKLGQIMKSLACLALS